MGDKEDVLPNMLILSRKKHPEKYLKKNNLKNNVCLPISDSGYSNNKIRV